ncbi:MAG: peptide chain release factor-like protein [Candidatus Omnitrophica bacterium]|nr:peptide chain release factor-like protein [Candidatus Omnitrophota bacterium]
MRYNVRQTTEDALITKMNYLGIRETDLEEKFILAGKKGGQKVNKSSVCVYLKHTPSGIEVKCQEARSQALNRFLARKIMAAKIESAVMGKKAAAVQEIEKIRRQKRKRSKRAREKMLRLKKIRSEKKESRRFSAQNEL